MKRLFSFEHFILLGFVIALFILGMVGLASYWSTTRFIETSWLGLRNAEVLIPLQSIATTVQRAESAQRGYLLTGSEQLRRRNEQALVDLAREVAKLRTAAAHDPVLAQRADEIDRLVAACNAAQLQVLRAYQTDGPEQARALLLQDTGRTQTAALETAIAQVVDQLRDQLLRDAAASRADGEQVMRYFFVALGLVMLLLLSLSTLVLGEMLRRQRATKALADSEAKLQTLVDTAVDAFIVIDERGNIESYNRAAEAMFGYAAAEVIGRNVSMLMPSPYREEHDKYLERYLRTGERRVIGIGREVYGQRSDGSVFPIDLAVAEFRVGGRRRFSGIIRDISERKQAEARQAQLVQDLAAANEELSSFAYVASHDLKAPLRAIAALADWISTDYADKFDEDGKEQMRLLIGRVHRMDQLIDGILQYSRVGRVREESVPVALNALLREIVDLLAPPAEISVEIGPMPTVVVEPTRIQQVFQNLLSNAIRYMDKPQGRIEVGAQRVGNDWRFHVRDNGPGIEARHQERIFALFQTLQPRDRTESTGIGLSLVKKIVELYGGRVWLESTPGEGSTFYFTLPQSRVIAAVQDKHATEQ